jgi:molecular chaperone DnaK (HSP70)
MSYALGVDLGAEFCRLAACAADGGVNVVASQQRQDDRTPSALAFAEAKAAWSWGWAVQPDQSSVLYNPKTSLLADRPQKPEESLDGIHPTWRFLKALRDSLPEKGEASSPAAVAFTVPYAFATRERRALRQAAERADFGQVYLINDAEAALLGAGIERKLEEGESLRVLLLDVGSWRTAVSVLEASREGAQLTTALLATSDAVPGVRPLQAQVLETLGHPPPDELPLVLLCPSLAECWGRAIAGEDATDIRAAGTPVTLRGELIRRAGMRWSGQVAKRVQETLAEAELSPGDLDFVVAAGGGAPMAEALGLVAGLGKRLPLPAGVTSSGVSARGAARYARIRSGEDQSLAFVSPEMPAIGIELADGAFHPVLAADAKPPEEDFRVFQASSGVATALRLVFREGFCQRAAGNRLIAEEELGIVLGRDRALVKVAVRRLSDGNVRVAVTWGDSAVERRLQIA